MMFSLAERIQQARLGGQVERCHNIPHLGSYTNAHHTWNVLILMWYLFPQHWRNVAAVVMAHDVPEGVFGDVVAPVMRYASSLKPTLSRAENMYLHDIDLPSDMNMTDEEYEAYKACDRLDLYLWCLEQENLGNINVREVKSELTHFFEETPLPNAAHEFWMEMRKELTLPRQARLAKHYLER